MIYPWFIWQYHAKREPNSTAVFLNQRPLTWGNLSVIIDRIAASFARQGVTEGDGILLRGNNSFQLLTAYLAGLQIGARVLPMNPKMPAAVVERIILKTNIGFYWSAEEETLPACGLELDPTKPKKDVVFYVPYDPDRVATLTLTSGSSGLPKAAAHTIAAHCKNAEGVAQLMNYHQHDNWLLSLPLYHVSGQGIVWRWLVRGARLAVREDTPLWESLEGVTHA
ncbi:MAG: AMP-binding protein, partial [Burkholderiales bacterium]|nr:AMP-binding protein [Burkholderiales bacterium]